MNRNHSLQPLVSTHTSGCHGKEVSHAEVPITLVIQYFHCSTWFPTISQIVVWVGGLRVPCILEKLVWTKVRLFLFARIVLETSIGHEW